MTATQQISSYSESAIDCKWLSYKIKGNVKWCNEGYELCFDGVQEKFAQNELLLSLLKITSPKILAKATLDRLWGTGIALRDTCALNTDKLSSTGWLSRRLLTIREELLKSLNIYRYPYKSTTIHIP